MTGRILFLTALALGAVARAADLRPVVDLNTGWEAAETRDVSVTPPATGWAPRTIPFLFSSDAKGGSAFGWYRRSVELPADWAGKRVFLRFGGVRWNARVYWDGVQIGQRLEGFTPWELELSATASGAGSHRLVVVAQDWGATFADGWTLPADATGELRYQTGGRTLAPVGGQFWRYGIWDDVRLEARPAVFLEDVAIVPSVRQGTLTVTARVNGGGSGAVVDVRVLDGDRLVPLEFRRRPPSGESLMFEAKFPDPKYWSPESPHRYALQLHLTQGGSGDRLDIPFGFRELRALGPDFYLNGVKRHLLATSAWPHPDDQPVEQIREVLTQIREAHTTVFRLHTQPWREVWLEEADRAGIMIVDEGALWCDGGGGYAYGDPRFWSNVRTHLEGMIRRDRNRASLVMWSLENELLHCGGKSATVDVEVKLAELGRFVKSLDPSHLITFEADLDPKGVADVIGLHYPHELPDHHAYPDTADWLDSSVFTGTAGGLMGSRMAAFRWDRKKPLYIGEYLWVPDGSAAAGAVYFGDAAYLDPSRHHLLAKAKSWEDQAVAYRRAGVSAQCPWTMFEGSFSRFPLDLNPAENPLYQAQRRAYAPVAAFLRERDTRVFRGDTLTRTFDVFNDTAVPAQATLTWSLVPGGPAGSVTLLLEPAGRAVVPVPMVAGFPAEAVRSALITVLGVNGYEVHRARYDWTVHSRYRFRLPAGRTLRLLDPDRTWRDRFAAAGLAATPWSPGDPLDGAGEILIVAPGALGAGAASASALPEIGRANPLAAALAGFLRAGGRALVLEQEAFGDALPGVTTAGGEATMAFGIAEGDPLMAGLQPADFSFWRPGHLVARSLLRRPATGGARSIAVAGTRDMLASTPALDLPVGRGRVILLQALVGGKFDTEPAARRLLQNALLDLAAPPPESQAVVIGADAVLADALRDLGADARLLAGPATAADLPGATLVVLHGGGPAVTGSKPALARWLGSGPAGRRLLWHAPEPGAFNALKAALGVGALSVVPAQGPLKIPDRNRPLLAGISREDLWFLGPGYGDAWMRRADPDPGVADRAFLPALPSAAGMTIRAVTMTLTGAVSLKLADGSGVGIYANGSAKARIAPAARGLYPVSVRAAGTPCQGQYPLVGIRAAGREVARFGVTGRALATYTVLADLPAGNTELELVFDNDASGNGEDRNLTLAAVTIGRTPWTPAGLDLLCLPTALVGASVRGVRIVLDGIRWDRPGLNRERAGRFASALLANLGMPFRAPVALETIPLRAFAPVGTVPYFSVTDTELRQGGNGAVEAAFRCATPGRWRLVLRGAGTAVRDEYPKVRVTLDGAPAGAFELRADAPREFTGDPLVLTAGDHRLRLEFHNDAFEAPHDRNLLLHAAGFRRDE